MMLSAESIIYVGDSTKLADYNLMIVKNWNADPKPALPWAIA